MASKKTKKDVLDKVKDALEDEEFDPDDEQRLDIFSRRRKTPDEIAIDEMLIGLEGNDWYLKLSKEITPNTFQFKKRIDQFHHITDLELEMNNLVRAETLAEFKKTGRIIRWGSGRYMVTFFKEGGIRGEKRKPVFFDIDAEEPEQAKNGSPDLSVIQSIIDRQPSLEPNDAMKLAVDSMHKGMELATMKEAKAESSGNSMMQLMMAQMQSSTQMMVGLITALVQNKPIPPDTVSEMNKMAETFKNMGIIGQPKIEKSMFEQVKELQELGILKKPDSDDAIKSIENMKKIASIISDMSGGSGERPGVFEKIIDVVGNNIPGIVNAVNTMAAAQAKRPMVIQPVPRQVVQRPEHETNPQIDTFENGHEQIDGDIQVPPMPPAPENGYITPPQSTIQKEETKSVDDLKNSLWKYVESKDYSKFPEITAILGSYFQGTENVVNMIKNGQLTVQSLLTYILMADKRYIDRAKFIALQDYANHYIASFNPTQQEGVVGKCQLCGAEFDFNNKQEYIDEQGENEGKVVCGTDGCQGEVTLQ